MNKFFKAMFCVTFFSVITRGLGFILKIYLSRKMSSDLLGSYQVAMSIFAVFMTFVSSGIPVVLSRNISYYHGQKNKQAIGSTVTSGLILTALICFLVSIFIIFFPNVLNGLFTSNATTEMLIYLLPALIFSSIYEVLRGALWGQKEFFTISFTEFFEQAIRIIFIVILFETNLINISATNKTALSLSLACIFSSIFVFIIFIKKGGTFASPKLEFKKFVKTSAPITAVRTISAIVSSIISIIIPLRLMKFGYSSKEALSEFGILMGMTFPLIMIPSTLIGSLAVTIIPSISEKSKDIDKEKNININDLKSKISFALKLTSIFSTIMLPIYISLGIPICEFLFKNNKAGVYLSIASIAMLPMGISQITSSILNAIGLEIKSLKNYAISSLVLILIIFFLPKYIGTYSLILGYFTMSSISSILNLSMLKKRRLLDSTFIKTTTYMLLISIFSACLGSSIYGLTKNYFLINLIIPGTTIAISMFAFSKIFNVIDFKFLIFKKRKHSL